jgi:membrane dipeptidase
MSQLKPAAALMALLAVGCSPPDSTPGAAGATSEAAPIMSADANETAADIQRSIITIDSHDDIPLDFATSAVDPLNAERRVNLQGMRAGGLDTAFFIVYVGQTARTAENYAAAHKDALTKFDAIHRMTEQLYPDLIELAYTPDDVERIWSAGKLVAVIGIENGYVIGKDLSLLDDYYGRGARYMTLAHDGHNDIADSARPRTDLNDSPAEHGGLSEFGAEVIARMNRLGMLVDVSHISKQAALDAIHLSRAPVIASHSSVNALNDHPRNMDDETLRALAATGGVVQIVAFDPYLKPTPPERVEALRALYARLGVSGARETRGLQGAERQQYEQGLAEIDARWPPATVADFADHIDYAVKLIGIDHVGIASDFDGGGGVVGWNNAAETLNVTTELVRRGYDRAAIGRLWGGNLLRVWREADRVAAQLQLQP